MRNRHSVKVKYIKQFAGKAAPTIIYLMKTTLTYYTFDFDDNILFLPTKIFLEKKVGRKWIDCEVTTAEFARIRASKIYRLKNNNPEHAFVNFRDVKKDVFLKDVTLALSEKQYAPSWKKFKKCIISGNIFAIITSRGHSEKNIKKAIKYIIDNCFTDEEKILMSKNLKSYLCKFGISSNKESLIDDYLNKCEFIGVSNTSWLKKNNLTLLKTEYLKEIAFKKFLTRIHKMAQKINAKVKVGMSDDDVFNINHLHNILSTELYFKYPNSKIVLYDTSKNKVKKIESNGYHN